MKNIHVIPTDKPSRLQKFMNHVVQKIEFELCSKAEFFNKGQNIYITSDEKNKRGDWYFAESLNEILQYTHDELLSPSELKENGDKKIILTTDTDLIKDGVQAITDEFLEWFVKNPSCERVETKLVEQRSHLSLNDWVDVDENGKFPISIAGAFCYRKIYKIIILKEELKQDTVGKEFYESADKTITVYRQETLEEAKQEQKQHLIDLMRLDEQGTLEEVSPMNDLLIDLKETKISVKESIDIIEDEFMRTQINIFVQKTLDSVIDRIENELLETESKWQQEQDKNKYSEEEVLDLLYKRDLYLLNRDEEIDLELPDKWFEQFKKK